MPRSYDLRGLAGACAFALVLATAPAGIAAAQGTPDVASPPPAPSAIDERDADGAEVATIVMHSVSEVKLCGLAAQKSQDADIRSLCRKASADSAKSALSGLQLAQHLGEPGLKLQPSPDTPAAIDTLSQYSGEAFDRAFLLAQIHDGAADEQAIEYAAAFTNDKSVKSYENNVLPRIADRVELAEGALRRISESQQ